MISSSIIDLVLNKYTVGGLIGLISLIIAYFKGSSAANKANEAAKALEERARLSRIRSAEAKNQFLQQKGAQTNEQINASDSIDTLIGVFDALQHRQSKSTNSNKDSKEGS